jgi:hypothetical protein
VIQVEFYCVHLELNRWLESWLKLPVIALRKKLLSTLQIQLKTNWGK